MKYLSLALALSFVLTPALAKKAPDNETKPAIYEYTLKNGLKLIVKPDHRSPIVVSQVWYKVGSSYEHNGITGISHALEHMMFRGTKQYPAGRFSQLISQNGGVENAFTFYDFTAFYQVLPASKLSLSFQLESDRMTGLLLDKTAFEKEMKAVMEERRLRTEDNPNALMKEILLAQAYISSGYHHPVIGWMNDLTHMTVEDLRAWYTKWYTPNNAILVVVGDVDPNRTFALANRYFSSIPAQKSPPLKPRLEIKQRGERKVNFKAPAKLPSLALTFHVPSIASLKQEHRSVKDSYALIVLSKVLDQSESSRLEKELVRSRQVATSASAYYTPYQRQATLFWLTGTPSQGKTIEELKSALLEQITRLKMELVDEKELKRVKTLAIAQHVYKSDSMLAQAEEIGELESVGLSWREIEDYVTQIEAITPEDIRQVARLYFNSDNLTFGELIPQDTGKPGTPSPKSTQLQVVHHEKSPH